MKYPNPIAGATTTPSSLDEFEPLEACGVLDLGGQR
jgi:hypothetical protein